MQTATELTAYVGKRGHILAAGLSIAVRVIDVKHVYGRRRYLVVPAAGDGQVWVEAVHFDKGDA